MGTSIKRCAVKVQRLCRLEFGYNNCSLYPNLWPVKQEKQERKRQEAEKGEPDEKRDPERR